MMTYKPGDVILVQFPFTDLSSSKKRPAVVLSPASFSKRHGDIIVLALTSQAQKRSGIRLKDWKRAGLPKPTWMKLIIGTISSTLVVRRLGELQLDDLRKIATAFPSMIAKEFLV